MGMTHDKMLFAYTVGRTTNRLMWDVERILRLGATHKRLAEDHCNGTCRHCTDNPDGECSKQKRIQAQIRLLGFNVQFQNDPRGHTVKLFNTNGDLLIGVPTS